jgi:hypothetical protein
LAFQLVVESTPGGPKTLAQLGFEGGEAGEARPEIAERPWRHGYDSGGLSPLLAEPAALLFGDQAITEAECVLAGQELQQGNKPADRIENGFGNRQLTAGAG